MEQKNQNMNSKTTNVRIGFFEWDTLNIMKIISTLNQARHSLPLFSESFSQAISDEYLHTEN